MKLKAKFKWKGKVWYEDQFIFSRGVELCLYTGPGIYLQERLVLGVAPRFLSAMAFPVAFVYRAVDAENNRIIQQTIKTTKIIFN